MTRFFVSAAIKSSGKTTVSIGLAAAIAARGLKIQTFKKGPDYIDPMWLARASGRASYNLDFNTQSSDEILALYGRARGDCDIALIEGNKGLHDGVDPFGGDSSAALAKLLRAPVVLVIDTTGMARGIAPLACPGALCGISVRIPDYRAARSKKSGLKTHRRDTEAAEAKDPLVKPPSFCEPCATAVDYDNLCGRASFENSGRERFLPSVEMTGADHGCHSERSGESFPLHLHDLQASVSS